jgi:hypothetical protein
MSNVIKFSTFKELKDFETKSKNLTASLKRHKEFEKFILSIRELKITKNDHSIPSI